MLPIVVVPALNEERSLQTTCRSLGFGSQTLDPHAILVIVDNGSTDDTPLIAERIGTCSRPGHVLVVHEKTRGYVPARDAGVRAAAAHAARLGATAEQTLVLQADADTVYQEGYVAAMISAASKRGRGFLYEGASIPPESGTDPCLRFRELEALIDGDLPVVPEESDVVVDDKVAAYILADYEAWGGHLREYHQDVEGDEWLAETTRLYVRARLSVGARRHRVDDAQATTSSRRILEDPAVAFATAGFPVGPSWRRRWHQTYRGPQLVEAFTVGRIDDLHESISMRRRHLAAMFRFLPEIVQMKEISNKFRPSMSDRAHYSPHGIGKTVAMTVSAGTILEDAFARAGIGS